MPVNSSRIWASTPSWASCRRALAKAKMLKTFFLFPELRHKVETTR
ncbi:hypothetical protein ABGB12_12580 [Actinocorallia sp. B10E7]